MNDTLPEDQTGGAIIYCATRSATEDIATYLTNQGICADYFHAKLNPDDKKEVQQKFIDGELRVIAATNAFGMGIDKSDVRVVIHADIPGSLENYLQEAGRAGRDRKEACCILLYTPDDVERQLCMSARSRLTQREIQVVLKSLRKLDKNKKQRYGEIIATTSEILSEDTDKHFERDSTSDDTRLRTAVSWLEEADLLERNENIVSVFPSSLRVNSFEEAKKILENHSIFDKFRQHLLEITKALIQADKDEGVSTDALMALTCMTPS